MNRFKRALGVLLGYEQGGVIMAEKNNVPDAPDDLYDIAKMAIERICNEPGAFDDDEYEHVGHKTWRVISNGVFSDKQQKELNAIYQKAYVEKRRDDARAKLLRIAMLGKEAFENPANNAYQGTQVYKSVTSLQNIKVP